jgi:hypothetical protein
MRRIFADDGIAYPRVSEPDDIIIHTAMLLPPAIDGIDLGAACLGCSQEAVEQDRGCGRLTVTCSGQSVYVFRPLHL